MDGPLLAEPGGQPLGVDLVQSGAITELGAHAGQDPAVDAASGRLLGTAQGSDVGGGGLAEGDLLGLIAAWVLVNTLPFGHVFHGKAFDPYPYTALNLVLPALAGIQAPIIIMSQNRAAARF